MSSSDTVLLNFLRGTGADDWGRDLGYYLKQPDCWWEENHDHIQWAFPLPEPSKYVRNAPVATQKFYDAVQSPQEMLLHVHMTMLMGRYLAFLHNTTAWMRRWDHNHNRITRVIRCLHLCGLDEHAQQVQQYCSARTVGLVPLETKRYWLEALNEDPFFLAGEGA